MSTLCEPIHSLDEFQRDSIVKVVMSKQNEALYFSRATILMIEMALSETNQLYILKHFVI